MSELIDRQAAIDALDTAIEHYDGIAEECRKKADIERNDYMDMRDDAYEARQLAQWLNELKYLREKIEQLTIKPEPHWIPVSERLPETEEFVLASLTGKHRNITFEHACEIADYADGEWCVYAYPHMPVEKCAELIEAWMPLPTPYTK